MKSPFLLGATFALLAAVSSAAEFHVAVTADGSAEKPFKTISAASKIAQPGDTITVHAGTYRERITPPRLPFHQRRPCRCHDRRPTSVRRRSDERFAKIQS